VRLNRIKNLLEAHSYGKRGQLAKGESTSAVHGLLGDIVRILKIL